MRVDGSRIVGSWLLVGVLLLAGCVRQSGRFRAGEERDSAAVSEILALRCSAFKSEDELINFVKTDGRSWTQHEFGWWYRYTHKGDTHVEYELIAPALDTCFVIHEKIYTLDGKLIVDAIREYDANGTSDENSEPFVYEIMMRELVQDDTIVILVPWMVGYGKEGKGFVPPQTNMRVELTIEHSPYTEVETIES